MKVIFEQIGTIFTFLEFDNHKLDKMVGLKTKKLNTIKSDNKVI